jgi:hypothetical protein
MHPARTLSINIIPARGIRLWARVPPGAAGSRRGADHAREAVSFYLWKTSDNPEGVDQGVLDLTKYKKPWLRIATRLTVTR